jgi:DNA repair photolyase
MAGVTDCYQPVERKLQVTRHCLEVFAEFGNPLWITTKNHLVTRDIDLLRQLAGIEGISVQLSITTLDRELARVMEPRTSIPSLRLEAITRLRRAGIPAGVLVAPIIPGLNDHEIPQILAAARDAGAGYAYMQMLRLPFALKELFVDWLRRHYPDRAEKVINRIKEMHGGKLNSSDFGKRMTGEGIWAEQIGQLFTTSRQRVGLGAHAPELSTAHFRRPGEQLTLF